jgi:hypothetical protein
MQQPFSNNQNPVSPLSHGMNYGAILGLGLVIISLLFYVLDQSESEFKSFFDYIIILGGIVLGTTSYRDGVTGGFLSYGGCFKIGVLVSFFASIIFSFYTYVFFSFMDPEVINVILEQIEQSMIDQGNSDEQIELAMGYTSQFMTPLMLTIGTLFTFSFTGAIFSLGTSFFLKRESDTFPTNFQ